MAELDDTTNCQVCFETFKETGEHVPRILQCFHTVCEKCIKQLMKENTLECPECRTKHPAVNGILSFPQNKYVISNIKRNAQFESCEIHNRVMTLFCKETKCKTPICSICLLNDHKNHDMTDYQQWYVENRGILLANLKSLESNLQSKREDFMTKKEILCTETEACLGKIREHKEEYLKTIENLIEEATKQMKRMQENIDEGITVVDTRKILVKNIEDSISTCTYKDLTNGYQTVSEIEESVTQELSQLMVHKYPTYTARPLADVCGKISMVDINSSFLQARSKLFENKCSRTLALEILIDFNNNNIIIKM